MTFFSRSSRSTSSSSLVSFYDGTGRDHRGRRLSEILHWGTGKLESSHDYIQTLFPLPEESGVNWSAPIIDRQVFNAFRSRPELRERLRDSFEKLLWFYGFKLDAENGEVKVSKGDNYDVNSENWDSRFDHNHLRITRIIRCLRVLGLEDEAKAFLSALENSTTRVSSRSREFWRRAAERDLNLRPDLEIDDESDNTIGQKFLREYELERKSKESAVTGHTSNIDQPGLEHAGKPQVKPKEKTELSDNGNDTEDQAQLETTQAHGVTEDEKKENPAS